MADGCATCRFALIFRLPDGSLPQVLWCRRYPPALALASTRYPQVTPANWCGEYQAASKEIPNEEAV